MDLVVVEEAKIIVGLDFGTTFSGFAYSHRSEPDKIYTFHDWPMQASAGGSRYCKTQSSLFYMPGETPDSFELVDWGWPAMVKYSRAAQVSIDSENAERDMGMTVGHFLTRFKLHLAGDGLGPSSAEPLPPGISSQRAISDYLIKLSEFILQEVQTRFGGHLTKDDIQWCVTVPVIWNDHAKQQMKTCLEVSGMVQGPLCPPTSGGSPYPAMIVLEPEAASVYCQLKLEDFKLTSGHRFLVVDVGGGTVDLVVHEKIGEGLSLQVREVTRSTGALCGGTFVDKDFFKFLAEKIGCFEAFARKNPSILVALQSMWEDHKHAFDGGSRTFDLSIPPDLAVAWEKHDRRVSGLAVAWEKHGRRVSGRSIMFDKPPESYDEIEMTAVDLRRIFDPTVNKILQLIAGSIVNDMAAIMVVGGFAASPYLMQVIRRKFSRRVKVIISPPEPGSAICCGAVTLGTGVEFLQSRISRKTYGVKVVRRFQTGDPKAYMVEDDDGNLYCDNVFQVFVRKGEEVPVNYSVRQILNPLKENQEEMSIVLYSTTDPDPEYVLESAVEKEGNFRINISSKATLGEMPKVVVDMYFGRSTVEVTATGANFRGAKASMLPVKFARDRI